MKNFFILTSTITLKVFNTSFETSQNVPKELPNSLAGNEAACELIALVIYDAIEILRNLLRFSLSRFHSHYTEVELGHKIFEFPGVTYFGSNNNQFDIHSETSYSVKSSNVI